MVTYNLKNSTTVSGITFSENTSTSGVLHVARPFMSINIKQDLIQNALNSEMSLRSGNIHKQIRKQLVSDYSLGNYSANVEDVQLDTRIDNITGKMLSDQTRERAFKEVPLAPIITLYSIAVAYDETTRLKFNNVVNFYPHVPTLTVEYLKKVRKSKCGKYTITPTLCEKHYSDILSELGLENSYLTLKALRSEKGQQEFLTFINLIISKSSDYFSYESTSTVNNISLYAGEQTTFCSLDIDDEYNNICVLQHNSYPEGTPTTPNLVDTVIVCPQHQKAGKHQQLTNSVPISVNGMNNSSLAHMTVLRFLGDYSNKSYIDENSLKQSSTSNSDIIDQIPTQSTKRPQRNWVRRNIGRELDQKEGRLSASQIIMNAIKYLKSHLPNDTLTPGLSLA